MNDDLAGQLVQEWEIPTYAQNHLWLDSPAASARCEGHLGLFELDAPADTLSVRWGNDDGAVLTQLKWQIDNLGWDGSVRLGGMIEAIHMTELTTLDLTLAVVFFSGQPLHPHVRPYPDASQRHLTHINVPDYIDGVDDAIDPTIVTLLAADDSPLVTTAHDAMLNKIPMHVYGKLADDESGWGHFFALPIIWHAVTLFSP